MTTPYFRLLRVCVTGPESTGKTTLAARIAKRFATEWVPEASRAYAERKGTPLTADDVTPIAREHVRVADERARSARTLLSLDTDLLSTVIYSRHYYGRTPPWIVAAERVRRSHLYLLCDVDVPWLPDGVRDRPANREEMFGTFEGALRRRALPYAVVRGSWSQRDRIADDAVDELLARTRRREEG